MLQTIRNDQLKPGHVRQCNAPNLRINELEKSRKAKLPKQDVDADAVGGDGESDGAEGLRIEVYRRTTINGGGRVYITSLAYQSSIC